MRRHPRFPPVLSVALLSLSLLMTAGCFRTPDEPAAPPGQSNSTAWTGSSEPAPWSDRAPASTESGAGAPEVSWDTEADHRFATFLQKNSGGMIAKAAVGLARKGTLQVVLDESAEPEDTLDLTKALITGARKDFPDRPITLKVFDPAEAPILTARYRPGQGVDYQLADSRGESPSPSSSSGRASESKRDDTTGAEAPSLRRGGVTPQDREFARWAEETGQEFLRYVQADLENHGRLWFGVTRAVAPDDVPDLTRSLLEGARKDFPRRTLRATVLDPDGERIGTATLDRDGRIHWEE